MRLGATRLANRSVDILDPVRAASANGEVLALHARTKIWAMQRDNLAVARAVEKRPGEKASTVSRGIRRYL